MYIASVLSCVFLIAKIMPYPERRATKQIRRDIHVWLMLPCVYLVFATNTVHVVA